MLNIVYFQLKLLLCKEETVCDNAETMGIWLTCLYEWRKKMLHMFFLTIYYDIIGDIELRFD